LWIHPQSAPVPRAAVFRDITDCSQKLWLVRLPAATRKSSRPTPGPTPPGCSQQVLLAVGPGSQSPCGHPIPRRRMQDCSQQLLLTGVRNSRCPASLSPPPVKCSQQLLLGDHLRMAGEHQEDTHSSCEQSVMRWKAPHPPAAPLPTGTHSSGEQSVMRRRRYLPAPGSPPVTEEKG